MRSRGSGEAPGTAAASRTWRAKLTYANIVSTIALLLAVSGGAAYASTFLITATNQIAPSVRDALRSPVLHSYDAGPVTLGAKLETVVHLQLPPKSATLVQVKIQVNTSGNPDTYLGTQCILYVSEQENDTGDLNGPAGDGGTLALQLSVPAQGGATRALVECNVDSEFSLSGGSTDGTSQVSLMQEDATELQ